MHDHRIPYLKIVGRRVAMEGKGAPTETIFGVLGHTKYDPYMKSLGGLVKDTKPEAKAPKVESEKEAMRHNTERHIAGPKAKTPMPGEHYGMVPYPGHFQSSLGKHL